MVTGFSLFLSQNIKLSQFYSTNKNMIHTLIVYFISLYLKKNTVTAFVKNKKKV